MFLINELRSINTTSDIYFTSHKRELSAFPFKRKKKFEQTRQKEGVQRIHLSMPNLFWKCFSLYKTMQERFSDEPRYFKQLLWCNLYRWGGSVPPPLVLFIIYLDLYYISRLLSFLKRRPRFVYFSSIAPFLRRNGYNFEQLKSCFERLTSEYSVAIQAGMTSIFLLYGI